MPEGGPQEPTTQPTEAPAPAPSPTAKIDNGGYWRNIVNKIGSSKKAFNSALDQLHPQTQQLAAEGAAFGNAVQAGDKSALDELNPNLNLANVPVAQQPTGRGFGGRTSGQGESHNVRNLALAGGAVAVGATVVGVGELAGVLPPASDHKPGNQGVGNNPSAIPVETPQGTVNVTFPDDSPSPAPSLSESPSAVPSASLEPNPSPTPTEMPTPSTEPSPTSSPTPTGSPEATPTPENTNDLITIVEQYAQFDPGGKLSDKTGDFNLEFSRSVLAKAGVQSISLSPDIMQKAHDIITEGTYKAVRKAPGSQLQLGAQTGENYVSVPTFDNITGIIVSPEEYTSINTSREQNKIPYGAGGDGGILFVKDGTLYAIEASSSSDGLWGVPADWNKVGGGSRVAFDGFGHLYLDLAVATQWRYLNPPFTNPDNLGEYKAVGITEQNYQLSDGDFQIVYNNS